MLTLVLWGVTAGRGGAARLLKLGQQMLVNDTSSLDSSGWSISTPP